jgi:hypothetical protein
MYSDPEKSSQMVKLLKTKNKENAAGVAGTVYNVAFVVYSMRAVRDVLLFCCVPNPQLSRSTTSYSLSPIRYSSIHPSIHIYTAHQNL